MVFPPRTWLPLAVLWCHECAYRPNVLPNDPDKPELLPGSRSQTFQRSFLRVSDTRFYFSFAIGIFNPARHSHDAVVCEHISKQRVECGIVNVRNDDFLAQIIENYQTRTPTESTKRFSWSSAQTRELERNNSKRTDLRL